MAESTNNPNNHGVHDHGHEPAHEHAGVAHERRDVNVFQISAFGIGLLLGCIVVVFAMYGLFTFLFKREDAKNLGNPTAAMSSERITQPPEPRLQAEPKVELKDLKADEETILTSYGWIDPNKGIVRIPVDQAIDIVAQK